MCCPFVTSSVLMCSMCLHVVQQARQCLHALQECEPVVMCSCGAYWDGSMGQKCGSVTVTNQHRADPLLLLPCCRFLTLVLRWAST